MKRATLYTDTAVPAMFSVRRSRFALCDISSSGIWEVKKDQQLFVEQRPKGDYAVRRANSERASAVAPTQGAAIARAKEISPNATPMVERVRHTVAGKPDQWRKP